MRGAKRRGERWKAKRMDVDGHHPSCLASRLMRPPIYGHHIQSPCTAHRIPAKKKRGPRLKNLFSRHGSLLKTDRTTSDCLLSTTGQGGPTTRKSNKKNNSTIQIRRSYIQTSKNAITSQALWLLNRWPYVWECLSGLASPLLITYTRLHIVWELLLHSQSCWFGVQVKRFFPTTQNKRTVGFFPYSFTYLDFLW